MTKCHLLMKKEDIDERQLDGKIAVVFDVLLATSTITAALFEGAREVIPVLDGEHALKEAESRKDDRYILAGEYEGLTIDGFLSPSPLQLKEKVKDQTMILATTNGTVAIHQAMAAKKVYVASMLNGDAVAEEIKKNHPDETVVLICSGSAGRFNLEDFYGAGYFIDCLVARAGDDTDLTDAARTALYFYRGNSDDPAEMLAQSKVGKMLSRFGFREDIRFVSQRGIFPVVPYLNGSTVVL